MFRAEEPPYLLLRNPHRVESPEHETAAAMSEASEPSAWLEDKPLHLDEARHILNENSMFIQKGALGELPPSVEAVVERILSPDFLRMSRQRAWRITKELAEYEGGDDFSRFAQYWGALTHNIAKKLVNINGVDHYMPIDTEARGLRPRAAREFNRDGMCSLRIDDPYHKELAAALSVPKPRKVYGLGDAAFNAEEMRANRNVARWAGLVEGNWHSFMLVESQCGNDTSIECAEVRALRAGSALVQAHREMKSRAIVYNHQEQPADDASGLVFSLCFTPAIAKLYVHWANDADITGERYYMYQIRRYLPDEEDGVIDIRHDLDRIVDWGTWDRLHGPGGVKEMLWELKDKHINGF
ncbi:MAG: hypothetical protein LQ346_001358 [Caloplaca aetnensis]|nr:MAG: hypothetical protein LQ346_001358 [Caloplaca aetnensis]